MSQGPLMVLDSAGLWFRAFHSVPEKITGPDGAPANAVRGFCDMVAVLVEEYSPTGLVAALATKAKPGAAARVLGKGANLASLQTGQRFVAIVGPGARDRPFFAPSHGLGRMAAIGCARR